MFEGFTQETSEFLWELSFNNERPWFLLASFRFRGLRKSRESCTSAISFFLSTTNPLRWALWLLNLGIPSVS